MQAALGRRPQQAHAQQRHEPAIWSKDTHKLLKTIKDASEYSMMFLDQLINYDENAILFWFISPPKLFTQNIILVYFIFNPITQNISNLHPSKY